MMIISYRLEWDFKNFLDSPLISSVVREFIEFIEFIEFVEFIVLLEFFRKPINSITQ